MYNKLLCTVCNVMYSKLYFYTFRVVLSSIPGNNRKYFPLRQRNMDSNQKYRKAN